TGNATERYRVAEVFRTGVEDPAPGAARVIWKGRSSGEIKQRARADRTVQIVGRVGPRGSTDGPVAGARARKVQSGKQLVEQHRVFTPARRRERVKQFLVLIHRRLVQIHRARLLPTQRSD